MIKDIELRLSPEAAADPARCRFLAARHLNVQPADITGCRAIRRSIDARSRAVKVNLRLRVVCGETPGEAVAPDCVFQPRNVAQAPEVIIVGAGPAGLFAALRLIELGFKPVVLERGKDVTARRKDIVRLNRAHTVDPESNYCFGEGGAGTFSDGKLYTRSTKRGDTARVLNLLHLHGAPEDILIDVHPHIGTDRLPRVVTNIRETLRSAGAEIRFNTPVADLMIAGDTVKGVVGRSGERIAARAVILATGHSAREMYTLFARRGLHLEAKPFAMGVRVEHPQPIIDALQYHGVRRSRWLPAATYRFAEQVEGRGTYSFCMCPGGFIVPAATAPGEIVVNGMSTSRRNSPFANSGLVVEIRCEDLEAYRAFGALAGMHFQQALEQLAFRHGGGGQTAPAQRMADFVGGKSSGDLPACSYRPGVVASPLHAWLPGHIRRRLQQGLQMIDRKRRGFLTNAAILVGVESRTSAPVKIPRDAGTLEHVQIKGLYPCGEGAGYAGGIVSSAMDGERCAEKIAGFHP